MDVGLYIKVIHRPGREQVVPDCLSRFPIGTDGINSLDFKGDVSAKCAWYMCERVRKHPSFVESE